MRVKTRFMNKMLVDVGLVLEDRHIFITLCIRMAEIPLNPLVTLEVHT